MFKKFDPESEHLYAMDTTILLFGSVLSFLSLLFTRVIFHPRIDGLASFVMLFGYLGFLLFSLGSVLFLLLRIRKYGAVIAVMPLIINLFTLSLHFLDVQPTMRLSDLNVSCYSREYSPNGKYVYFVYGYNDGLMLEHNRECVLPVADTTDNLTNFDLPKGLSGRGWNQDNTFSVYISSSDRDVLRHYNPGGIHVSNGITLRIVASQQ